MVSLERTHLYTQSIFNSALVAHKDNDYIRDKVEKFYPDSGPVEIYRENHAQAYWFRCNKFSIIAINGTDGSAEDWKNNFVASVNKYFHKGISEEYYRDLSPFIMDVAKIERKHDIPIKIFAHSQGDAEGNLAVLQIREKYHDFDVEAVGSCGPRLCTSAGIGRMRAVGCRITHIINAGDLVPLVGGIIFKIKPFKISWAGNYGYMVKLPKVEKHIVMGHAWSNVMDGLDGLYKNWGRNDLRKPLSDIREVAKL
jgi:hypothetical protein